jgi:hypothetical protein
VQAWREAPGRSGRGGAEQATRTVTLRLLALLLLPLLLGGVARAQEGRPAGPFPQFAGEVWMGLYTVGNYQASDRERRGSTTFLFGEVAGGLYISPSLSLQSVIHVEPVGEVDPNGTSTVFRYQGAYLEALYADWRVAEQVRLYGGKFSAPFGYGHHFFPGILPMIRAHEVYLIRESIGAGATWTFLSDATYGEHDLSAAVFTFDTSPLSNTAFTRKRCCLEGFERYRRNVLHQGGAGNNGHLNNFAIALDGDRIGALPNFTYHLALLSRGEGKQGTRREWGWAAGARYEARWTPALRTLFFGEHVEFRNAGGRPLEEGPPTFDPATGDELPGANEAVRETRRFSTLGAQTTTGPWRAAIAWQRDERKRAINTLATEHYLEVSAGRELLWGFGIDLGYQYAHYARDDGTAGRSNAILGRLGFRRAF